MDTAIARKRLEGMRGELDKSIAVLQGEHQVDGEGLSYPKDQADAGANLSEADRTAAALAGLRSQLSHVLDALLRIEHGTYGTCTDCGGPIPEGRLDARPDADRCVACQAKRDRLRR